MSAPNITRSLPPLHCLCFGSRLAVLEYLSEKTAILQKSKSYTWCMVVLIESIININIILVLFTA